jgi:hypothetical protein
MNVEDYFEQQYALVTRAQAGETLKESAIDRRLANGRWAVEFPNVYRLVGAPRSGRQRAMAATLWAGADSAISHTTAARLLRLPIAYEGMHLTVPNRSGLRSDRLQVHRTELATIDRVIADGIPCTSATRTLVDAAPLVDGEVLENAFERARRMGLTSITALESMLRRGRPGSAKMRQVLAHAGKRPRESVLEVKFALLLRGSVLPPPVPQFEIGAYRVDYAWLRYRLVCECDGFEWHGSRLQWKRDRRRILR